MTRHDDSHRREAMPIGTLSFSAFDLAVSEEPRAGYQMQIFIADVVGRFRTTDDDEVFGAASSASAQADRQGKRFRANVDSMPVRAERLGCRRSLAEDGAFCAIVSHCASLRGQHVDDGIFSRRPAGLRVTFSQ